MWKAVAAIVGLAAILVGWWFNPSQQRKRRVKRERKKLRQARDDLASGDADGINDSLDNLGL